MKPAKWELDPETGCWNWLLYVDKDGYGARTVNGRQGQRAHRVAYAEAYGPIPDGLTVDHLCFNPPCVNPSHLRLLTNAENAGNQRAASAASCRNGHGFTPENTYETPAGRRRCRACNHIAVQEYRARNPARALAVSRE